MAHSTKNSKVKSIELHLEGESPNKGIRIVHNHEQEERGMYIEPKTVGIFKDHGEAMEHIHNQLKAHTGKAEDCEMCGGNKEGTQNE